MEFSGEDGEFVMETGEGERSFLKDRGTGTGGGRELGGTYFHQCVRAVRKAATEGETPTIVNAFKKVSRKSNLRESSVSLMTRKPAGLATIKIFKGHLGWEWKDEPHPVHA